MTTFEMYKNIFIMNIQNNKHTCSLFTQDMVKFNSFSGEKILDGQI